MCGIAALISLPEKSYLSELKEMTDIVHHRGPDGFGYWSEEGVHFGHRRLAIVDLSEGGHQPMHFKDRYVITYNGEIYNHVELREYLESQGYVFKSSSDTEVILAAYDHWGVECLNQFNGMWAFVIYDRKEKKVFSSRDRFGVKPLYYWHSPDGFLAFSSEIKQFTVLPQWGATIETEPILDFLIYGIHNHLPQTMFKNVFQVLPGHFIFQPASELSDGKVQLKKWYSLPTQRFSENFQVACENFKSIFNDAVRLRLRADVAVGSCLSGGLDSSSIVCTVNDLLRAQSGAKNQNTFSAFSEDAKLDESRYVKAVSEKTGAKQHSVTPDFNELVENLDKLTWHQDEPFGSTSIWAQWKVFELAKKNNCKVMLDGQGADEQLAGYSFFAGARLTELLVSFRWIRFFQEFQLHRKFQGHSVYKMFQMILGYLFPSAAKNQIRRWIGKPSSHASWLKIPNGRKPKNPYDVWRTNRTSVNSICRSQMSGLNLQMLLQYEDRNSMAHSVEARVPFVDYRMVEFNLSLPSDFVISDGLTKKILRKSMQETLPDLINQRMDKIGFATAEEAWMKSQPQFFRDELQTAVKVSGGLISVKILQEFDEIVAGHRDFDFYIWRVISLGRWIQKFQVKMS